MEVRDITFYMEKNWISSVGFFPSFSEGLSKFISQDLLFLAGGLTLLSCLPLNADFLLGNSGEILFSPLAAFILFLSSGCVAISHIVLEISMWIGHRMNSLFGR